MEISDRITGPAISLAGLALMGAAAQIPAVPGTPYGPGLMPGLIGAALACLGLRIGLRAWLAPAGGDSEGGASAAGAVQRGAAQRGAWIDLQDWRGNRRGLACAAYALLGMLALGLGFESLGFPLLAFLYALGLMRLMGAGLGRAALASALLVGLLDLCFGRLLGVPLPHGPLAILW